MIKITQCNDLLKKFCVLNDIDKELKRRDSYQGKKLEQTL